MKFKKIVYFFAIISFQVTTFAQETNCTSDGLGGFRCTTRPNTDQFLDLGAFQRGADFGNQQNMLDVQRQQLLQQQQLLQRQQQQQQQQQVEQYMRNVTRQNIDAANMVNSGMSVDEVVRLFGSYPFHRAQFKVYDTMQWCRTSPPGQRDHYAVVYFYEGKVAKVIKDTQMVDIDCRTRPLTLY